VDRGGRSYVSMEDMAAAVLDEIEQPTHWRGRFTAATASR
jgi:putative NADH-flavin reductase